MSVASHLAVSPSGYDCRIRQLLPHYDELIAEAARALGYSLRRIRLVVDLGVGTAALTRACLVEIPSARVWGIDADPAMLALANARLGRRASRATLVEGSFVLDRWIAHMARSCGGASKARRVYQSWGDEDTYLPLSLEQRLLARAGFHVDVPWRRSPFAVIVGVKTK